MPATPGQEVLADGTEEDGRQRGPAASGRAARPFGGPEGERTARHGRRVQAATSVAARRAAPARARGAAGLDPPGQAAAALGNAAKAGLSGKWRRQPRYCDT